MHIPRSPRTGPAGRATPDEHRGGPVVVAVEAGPADRDALEWAAAQASAAGRALRIVHAYRPLWICDPAFGAGLHAVETAHAVVAAAAAHVRAALPELAVDTRIVAGSSAAGVLRLAACGSLLVLGPSRRRAFDVVLRRSPVPVAIVRLAAEGGPMSGQVVVACDGTPESAAATQIASEEAARRGLAVARVALDRPGPFRRLAEAGAVRELVSASRTAALVVLPGRLARRAVLRRAAAPVLVAPRHRTADPCRQRTSSDEQEKS